MVFISEFEGLSLCRKLIVPLVKNITHLIFLIKKYNSFFKIIMSYVTLIHVKTSLKFDRWTRTFVGENPGEDEDALNISLSALWKKDLVVIATSAPDITHYCKYIIALPQLGSNGRSTSTFSVINIFDGASVLCMSVTFQNLWGARVSLCEGKR